MNKNKKVVKALSSVLCASMLMGGVVQPIYASTNETQSTSSNDKKEVEVLYNKSASYFVTIPKTITLDSNKESTYNVKVEGDIPSDKNVYVAPEDAISQTDEIDFYMHDQSTKHPKEDVAAIVTQNKDTWDFEEVQSGYEETTNKISASQLTAGNWKGTFNFNINMKGAHKHTYTSEVTKEPTCTEAGVKTFTCENGDDSYTEDIPALGHDFSSEYTIDKEPTHTEAGSKSQHCSRCDAKQNVTSIPATGHKYGEVTYTWSDDNSTCTAKKVCSIDGYEETETVNTTNSVYRKPTCETKGDRQYTATFKNNAFTTQTKTRYNVIPVSHNYVNNVCTKCGSVEVKFGQTYSFGGYEWDVAEIDDETHIAVLQSRGVTSGYWPGYTMAQFGNGSTYSSDISYKDISEYDDKTKALYATIKNAEASTGHGLYLVNRTIANNTSWANPISYKSALKAAATNYTSFGATYEYAWTGSVCSSSNGTGAYWINSSGNVSGSRQSSTSTSSRKVTSSTKHYKQYLNAVVAPAFKLDLKKVTLNGNTLNIR